MRSAKPSLGVDEKGAIVKIDVPRLVETRALITATSGAGKSWLLRRLLEQTHGHVQQIVIDPEDEFSTLREKYDYVLAGRHGGDCPADVRSAELLAKKLLELGVSAIIGIYELQAHDRIRFVRLFLESLVNSPKELWHPCLVVIDEAHIFAPQVGDAESTAAVIDLMSRGRKRGFCGVPATQRLSKLHKDVAAEAGNVIVGRSTLDVDVKRAADSLGFSGRDDQSRIRALDTGHFFVYGPALTREVTQVRVGSVDTTHPRAGQRAAAPAPPQGTIKAVLAELADLPAEAQKKAQTEEEFRGEIKRLEKELRSAKSGAPMADPAAIETAFRHGAESVKKELGSKLRSYHSVVDKTLRDAKDVFRRAFGALSEKAEELQGMEMPEVPDLGVAIAEAREMPASPPATIGTVAPRATSPRPMAPATGSTLKGPEQRILDAIAWLDSIGVDSPQQVAVAFLAGYTYGGGAYNNPRGALRVQGHVEYVGSDQIRLTDSGRGLARFPETALDAAELHRRVLERLPGPERKILEVLIASYPKALANDELAQRSGYTPNGGAYNNPRGRLRTLGLIDYQSGMVVAKALLFPEAR